MREILFRGQDRMGDWVYGWYVYGPKNTGSHFIVSYNAYGTIMWYEVDPATVGQYTGRTDKNGKKIFEGDIIKAGWGYQGEVEFDSFKYAMMESTIDDNAEIIGNIHDNPELLEKEADR